jgi:CubicO group peptidase (beta-lactamase class C family)
MLSLPFIILSTTLMSASTQAVQVYTLLGPAYPPPQKLSSSSFIQSAVTNLTQMLQQMISTGNSTYGSFDVNNASFSVEVFSTHDDKPLFQQHYSAPILATSTAGVKIVDENSIYRIGSLSKLFTMFLFLIEAGDGCWSEPITKFVPELQAIAQKNKDAVLQDPIDHVSWDDVTIGALASHMADIGQACELFFGCLIHQVNAANAFSSAQSPGRIFLTHNVSWTEMGLPPLSTADVPPCGLGFANSCTRQRECPAVLPLSLHIHLL